MIPTIGRIVIYKTTKEQQDIMRVTPDCNVQEELPGMIVAVWGSEETSTVNLKVALDGALSEFWVTSAPWGDEPGQCHWPVKV